MTGSKPFSPLSFSTFWTVFQIVLGTPLKYELTFHNYSTSWNTAVNVCEANGGNLVQIFSQEKFDVIQYFKQNEWQNVLERDYWIGLFDDDVPNMRYIWLDCTLLAGNYHKWYETAENPEPNEPDTEMCVRNKKFEGAWRTKQCDDVYQFICEKTVGECTYSSLLEREFPITNDSELLPNTYANIEDCQLRCSGGDNSDKKCWAVTYGDVSGTCTIHRGPSPFTISLSDARPLHDHTASLRICYTAVQDQSDVHTALVDQNARPSLSCNVSSTPVTPQPTTGLQLHSSTFSHQDTHRFSLEPSTVETTTEYSATENTLLSSNSPEQSTVLVFPSSLSFDTTMWRVSEHCPGSTCTVTNQQDITESETSLESVTAIDMMQAVQTSSFEQVVSLPTSLCKCPCSTSLSEEESQVVISSILEQLTIEKKNVSAYKRKHTSAPDDRPSAQGIGYSGAIILGVVFGGLILLDLPTMYHEMKTMIRNLREI